MTAKPREHGTYTGYQQHIKRGEKPCQPCRDANAATKREWRQANPEKHATEIACNVARNRALERLAAENPDRFRVLVDEERSSVYAPGRAS